MSHGDLHQWDLVLHECRHPRDSRAPLTEGGPNSPDFIGGLDQKSTSHFIQFRAKDHRVSAWTPTGNPVPRLQSDKGTTR